MAPAVSNMEEIIRKIKSCYPVSAASLDLLCQYLEMQHCQKRHLLVKSREKSRYAFFIAKGMTRSYWVVDGEEITTSFSEEGDIVFSMDEVYYGRLSEEYVETLEETIVYRIPVEVLCHLVETNLELANWWRVIHQNEYRRIHRTHKERLTLPAAERYEAFCSQFPHVLRRANLGYIASYIGVTLSTLSRLRSVD